MSSVQEQMAALQAQMAVLQQRIIEEEAAKNVASRIATMNQQAVNTAKKEVQQATGGTRWMRGGGGISGSESSSAQDSDRPSERRRGTRLCRSA